MKGTPGRCAWCDGEVTGRRRKWCSDECRLDNWRHHDWNAARAEALRRDAWTCVRCGHVGWSDVPASVLRIPSDDRDELHPWGTQREDWAVALGLLAPKDAHASIFDVEGDRRRRYAIEQLPESITQLVYNERPGWNAHRSRHRPGGHELEVNHIEPRRGAGYSWGCHHHPENLETLCRPCHVDETTRQRRGLPSWRDDPRPLATIGTLFEEGA